MRAAIAQILFVILSTGAIAAPQQEIAEPSRVAALESKLAALEAKLNPAPVATVARVEKVEEKAEAVAEGASRDAEIDAIVAAVAKAVNPDGGASSEIPLGSIVIIQAFALVGLIVKEWFGQRASRERHESNVREIDWMDKRLVNVETDLGRKPPEPAPLPPVERRRAAVPDEERKD